jgi:hypothetical protein
MTLGVAPGHEGQILRHTPIKRVLAGLLRTSSGWASPASTLARFGCFPDSEQFAVALGIGFSLGVQPFGREQAGFTQFPDLVRFT